MLDLAAQITARSKVREQVVDHPADLPGEDQDRYFVCAVPRQQPPPHADKQPVVLSDLYRRNEQHIPLGQVYLSAAAVTRPGAQPAAEPYDVNVRRRPPGRGGEFKQSLPRILRDGEDRIRIGQRFLEPFSELNSVPSFDQSSIFNRNHIVNENCEPETVAGLRGGHMLCIAW